MLVLLIVSPCLLSAQLGIKAGLNFANITNASSINSSTRTGYHAGVFFATPSLLILGSRTELLFSRQGYNYSTNENTGNVNLDYILLPQMLAINITPLFQVQAGGQLAYLLNAEIDSTNSTGNITIDQALDLYNRLDFAVAGGLEFRPVKMLIVGARMNISLGRLYKKSEEGQGYSFLPDIDAKNNLFQLYAGMRFGL